MATPDSGASPSTGTDTSTKPPKMPLKRRWIVIAAVVVLTLVPAIVMVLVTWAATGTPQGAATWASIPAIVGIAAAFSAGRRYAVIVAIVVALLAPVSIVAGQSPVSGAALMAIMCLTVGRLARVGLQRSGAFVPVMLAWALIDPPTWNGATTVDRLDTPYLLWMAVIFLVGGLIPALVLPFVLRKRKAPTLTPHSRSEATTYAVMITTLVTVSTFYVLDHPELIGGAFLIAVILMMAPIGTTQILKPTIFRILGTVLGSAFVVLLVSQIDSLALIYLIGMGFLIIALFARLSGLAWVYYVFMVPATAGLNSTTLTQVGELGRQRVIDNVVGGILVILAAAIAIAYSQWAMRHGHGEDEDQELKVAAADA